MVLDRGPARDLAVAAAHGEDRQLSFERHEAFEDARDLRRAALQAPSTSVGVAQHDLALAVVTAAPRLQIPRAARSRRPPRAAPWRWSTARNGAVAIPSVVQRLLLDDPVLGDVERARSAGRPARSASRARAVAEGTPSHSYVTTTASAAGAPRRGDVVEAPTTRSPTAAAGAPSDRVEEGERAAERDTGEPEHPAQLASAQHRDPRHARGTLAIARARVRLRARAA